MSLRLAAAKPKRAHKNTRDTFIVAQLTVIVGGLTLECYLYLLDICHWSVRDWLVIIVLWVFLPFKYRYIQLILEAGDHPMLAGLIRTAHCDRCGVETYRDSF